MKKLLKGIFHITASGIKLKKCDLSVLCTTNLKNYVFLEQFLIGQRAEALLAVAPNHSAVKLDFLNKVG